jgi:hypothetical protein
MYKETCNKTEELIESLNDMTE